MTRRDEKWGKRVTNLYRAIPGIQDRFEEPCDVYQERRDLRQEVERLTQENENLRLFKKTFVADVADLSDERDHLRAVIDGLRDWLRSAEHPLIDAANAELDRLLGAGRSQDAPGSPG